MSLAQLTASRKLWRTREVYRYRQWQKYRKTNRTDLRAKWSKLYGEARSARVRRDRQIAAKKRAKNVSADGIAFIAGFEGFRSCPYRDAVGVWTIGYGHTHGVGPSTKCLTRAQASHLLDLTVNEFAKGVKALLKRKPSQHEFDALVSFAYNVGLGALGGSTLLRKYNAGDKQGAADEFLRWDKAGGKALLGLTRRRRSERALFLR